ncbi:hypothetical protein E2C01_093190 [Portunus trituberculatus]|uniref:Uncharacterized protein n=1 Tax=Portunus trituberculatus TaxID=210409 RepID=A0A5B7JTU8_PORTR|nr:hypothetical protein [Portunus trituberculatus]
MYRPPLHVRTTRSPPAALDCWRTRPAGNTHAIGTHSARGGAVEGEPADVTPLPPATPARPAPSRAGVHVWLLERATGACWRRIRNKRY